MVRHRCATGSAGASLAYAQRVLELRLLGGFTVVVDGVERPGPEGKPARSVLAWLALHPGEHERARIAGQIWPGDLIAARRGLRNALSLLLKEIPQLKPYLVITRYTLGLVAHGVRTDVAGFETAVANGDSEQAIALARGPLLPGLGGEWLDRLREDLSDHERTVLVVLEERALSRGRPDRALELARRRHALHPLDEAAVLAVMDHLFHAGRDSEAVAELTALKREHRRRGIAFEPSPDLRALVARHPATGSAAAEGETGLLQAASRLAQTRVPSHAWRSYRWDAFVDRAPENDPHPDYARQFVRISFVHPRVEDEIRLVCAATEDITDLLTFFPGPEYVFRWQVDSTLDPVSPRVFEVYELRLDQQPLGGYRRRRAPLPDGSACEYAYPVPDAMKNGGLRWVDLVVGVRLWVGAGGRFEAGAVFWEVVTDAEFRLTIAERLRPERVTVSAGTVQPLGEPGPAVYGPTFSPRLAGLSTIAQFRFPVAQRSEVLFEVTQTRGR